MIADKRIESWLKATLNLSDGLSYSEKKQLEAGEVELFVNLKLTRLNAKIKLAKFSSVMMCSILLLLGLYQTGVGFGLIQTDASSITAARSEGLILIIAASAIMTLYRVLKDVRLHSRAEVALELDRLLRG